MRRWCLGRRDVNRLDARQLDHGRRDRRRHRSQDGRHSRQVLGPRRLDAQRRHAARCGRNRSRRRLGGLRFEPRRLAGAQRRKVDLSGQRRIAFPRLGFRGAQGRRGRRHEGRCWRQAELQGIDAAGQAIDAAGNDGQSDQDEAADGRDRADDHQRVAQAQHARIIAEIEGDDAGDRQDDGNGLEEQDHGVFLFNPRGSGCIGLILRRLLQPIKGMS